MGVGNLGCPLCGGQRARKTRPVGVTDCGSCGKRVCARHIEWRDDAWICKRCLREQRKGKVI